MAGPRIEISIAGAAVIFIAVSINDLLALLLTQTRGMLPGFMVAARLLPPVLFIVFADQCAESQLGRYAVK
jgi:hypothetical protein